MNRSINPMQTKTRTTLQQHEYYQQKFFSLFQNTYFEFQVKSIQDAIMQLKLMNCYQKRRFNWFQFDQIIGHKSYEKKSFSYKYVNEVLYKKYFRKTSKEPRVFVKRSSETEFKVMKQDEDNQSISLDSLNKESVTKVIENQIEKIQYLAKNDTLVVGDTLSISDEINIFASNPHEVSSCLEDFHIEFSYFEEE
ncbi:Hypothetical_protein [Hexamita inflata]|uniref:Hypothetical_protein n=1 Tax=Hexamita inflata TaxID=28002 RepID=A0AA86QU27_9EUKA|nr:Hypothetical protein HINF_LOCUS52370 [Hexamita inflata]